MNISDDLLCLYSGRVTEDDGAYTIEVPDREISQGDIQNEETYRVAVISSTTEDPVSSADTEPEKTTGGQSSPTQSQATPTQPPVSEGETRAVEIESIGEQGDGIAKIDRGYVVIVPDTEVGERVTVRLNQVQENVAFGEVLERHHDISQER